VEIIGERIIRVLESKRIVGHLRVGNYSSNPSLPWGINRGWEIQGGELI